MLAVERRKQILEQVHKDKKVIVSELSRQFRVSEETIRRDLEKLAEDGHVIKSYGGAVINEIGSIDLPFNVRWKSNSIGKQKIADQSGDTGWGAYFSGCIDYSSFYCKEY